MAKYRIVRPVKIEGALHKPGEHDLELEPKVAAPALKSGSLVAAGAGQHLPRAADKPAGKGAGK
jgi:hypothetical protein